MERFYIFFNMGSPEHSVALDIKVGKLKGSWIIVKSSWRILRADKEIILFPVLSGLISILAVILLSFEFSNTVSNDQGSTYQSGYGWLFMFLYYLFVYFITIFFQAGIVTIVHSRLHNKDVAFRDGLKNALRHGKKILAWSLIAATVGVLLNFFAERSKPTIKILIWRISLLWSVATFFIVPVLILEHRGLESSFRKSKDIYMKRWGESAILHFSVGSVATILTLLGVFTMLAALAAFHASKTIVIITYGCMVPYFLVLTVIFSSLSTIYRVVLYEYAYTGIYPAGFEPHIIQNTMQLKQ